jgi:hypothetical protein
MTELQTINDTNITAVSNEQQMISNIINVSQNPDINVDKLERLFAMQERMMDRQAKLEFNDALARIQAKMPRILGTGKIEHDKKNFTIKYLKYDDIDNTLRPFLSAEGFSLVHDKQEINNKLVVTTILKHRAGHQEEVSIPLPYDQTNAAKNAVQAALSTFTYGKRANVIALFNIVMEGEDNNPQLSKAQKINEKQIQEITNLLQQIDDASNGKSDVKSFLSFMKVTSVEQIACSQFNNAINALKSKLKSYGKTL